MLGIPDLDNARIGESGECVGVGLAPVGREHRLPYGEDADVALGIALQYGIDLRTPLQADGTCRRQQKHHPFHVGGTIEFLGELRKRLRSNRQQLGVVPKVSDVLR